MMFAKRTMFIPEFASKKDHMTHYLSMLKTDIRQFVSTRGYDSLLEKQEAARRHEIEIELHAKE